MSQNKGLKENNAELQEAFVKISNKSMQLASDLDTEKRRVSKLKIAQETIPIASQAMPTPEIATSTALSPVVDATSQTSPLSTGEVPEQSVGQENTEHASDSVHTRDTESALMAEVQQQQQMQQQQQIKVST